MARLNPGGRPPQQGRSARGHGPPHLVQLEPGNSDERRAERDEPVNGPQRALNAYLRLAELEQASGNDAAVEAVMEQAIDLDGYAEEPYRRLMTLHARHGRADGVKATWRRLQRRLVVMDLDPDPATACLYRRLVADESVA